MSGEKLAELTLASPPYPRPGHRQFRGRPDAPHGDGGSNRQVRRDRRDAGCRRAHLLEGAAHVLETGDRAITESPAPQDPPRCRPTRPPRSVPCGGSFAGACMPRRYRIGADAHRSSRDGNPASRIAHHPMRAVSIKRLPPLMFLLWCTKYADIRYSRCASGQKFEHLLDAAGESGMHAIVGIALTGRCENRSESALAAFSHYDTADAR